MDKPLICGSRRCVSYPFQCTGGNHCPFDKPFLCPNMDCQNALIKCTKSYIGGVFQPKSIVYEYKKMNVDKTTTSFTLATEQGGAGNLITGKIFYRSF